MTKQTKRLNSNVVIYDVERDHYFSGCDDRGIIVCNFRAAERYLNDLMRAREEDISMSEAIHDVIDPLLWHWMIKNEEISNKVFKHGDSNYISFGFDTENMKQFLNKETNFLFMDFNCVNKEDK